jgi:hypothetical protein
LTLVDSPREQTSAIDIHAPAEHVKVGPTRDWLQCPAPKSRAKPARIIATARPRIGLAGGYVRSARSPPPRIDSRTRHSHRRSLWLSSMISLRLLDARGASFASQYLSSLEGVPSPASYPAGSGAFSLNGSSRTDGLESSPASSGVFRNANALRTAAREPCGPEIGEREGSRARPPLRPALVAARCFVPSYVRAPFRYPSEHHSHATVATIAALALVMAGRFPASGIGRAVNRDWFLATGGPEIPHW